MTEDSLREIIREEVKRIELLNEIPELDREWVDTYITENYKESLNEMARINTKEFYGYFPYNKFELKIWSNDHNPPHFHVISEGWDIVVSIKTGDILRVKTQGKSSKTYKYVEDSVKDWLNKPCEVTPKITNRENAMSIWMQIN